jgi:hypothetical protein
VHFLTQKQAFLRVYIGLHNQTFLNKTFINFIGFSRRITRTECNALNALAEEMAGRGIKQNEEILRKFPHFS